MSVASGITDSQGKAQTVYTASSTPSASGGVTVNNSAIGSALGYTFTGSNNLAFQPVANLKLGSLADNGGPTQTIALLAGSPCIDVGSNVAAAKCLKEIRQQFSAAGFAHIPLVADIHFLPSAAMEAVEHVEKVRVNPGQKNLGLPTFLASLFACSRKRYRTCADFQTLYLRHSCVLTVMRECQSRYPTPLRALC